MTLREKAKAIVTREEKHVPSLLRHAAGTSLWDCVKATLVLLLHRTLHIPGLQCVLGGWAGMLTEDREGAGFPVKGLETCYWTLERLLSS